ncbi:MAG: Na+/H+ antiporter [Chlamydiales bacterium]|nr:Na+/H+ antiporter [Chlamydiales bacterium]
MEYILEIILGLFIAVVALGLAAKKLNIPYPIALVIGGLLLSFIPGIPTVELDPDLIFLTILPPILFSGGYFTSVGAFRSNIGPISLLAIGLVIITTLAVAIFTHYLDGLPWAAAFLLGAIISPPDAIAATAITQRLKVPHQLVTILDGESLVNDASALVIYRLALVALVTGSFSLFGAGIEFITVCIGGIAFGLAFGYVAAKIIKQITDPYLCITISLLLPYLSYLSADGFHMSGVLAAVTSGLYLGWQLPLIIAPIIRLETAAVWKMVVFLLNGVVFILIGLQLPLIIDSLKAYSVKELVIYSVGLNVIVILVRLLWVYFSIYLPVSLNKSWKLKNPHLGWKSTLIIGWCGMRGIVSLAAALALPIIVNKSSFPERNIIIFLTFTVIFTSLVLQGLTLPFLIRKLKICNGSDELIEEAKIRMRTSQAAIKRLAQFSEELDLGEELLTQLQNKYQDKIQWANTVINNTLDPKTEKILAHSKRIQLELLNTEREKIVHLRNQGLISGEVARRILNDIDFESARLHSTST